MTRFPILSSFSLAIFAASAMPVATAAGPVAERAALKVRISAPPPADLFYSIRSRQKDMNISGTGLLQWKVSGGRYTIMSETRAMLVGKILEEKSEGAIDEYGLAPASYTEKRLRRNSSTTSFNRQTRTISFTGSPHTYPIRGGEQDRISVAWQLAAQARAAPSKFRAGSSWTYFVVGHNDAEPWTFKVVSQEKIKIPDGEVNALRIQRAAGPDDKGRRLDLWLAPSLDWYPVRLRYSEADGDYIDQTLDRIERK